MDEERKQLLRRIVESLAQRQLAAIDIHGHCLKFVGELDVKVRIAEELDLSLRLFRQVHSLYRELGWEDLEARLRDRPREVPFPDSRLEFGIARYLTGLAEEVAMRSYVDCSVPEFAAIARTHVEASARRGLPERFLSYCEDPSNRPQAQQFLDRWLAIALASFGRVGTSGDARAVELGLRDRTNARMIQDFEERLEPLLSRCGLTLPEQEASGEA